MTGGRPRPVRTSRIAGTATGYGWAMQPIDFVGFAGDCTISGKMTMFGDRLTDFLNGQERFRIHQSSFESLEDGHKVAIDSVSVVRDDLFAVVATGPRGAEKQRVELQTNRLQISIGPYIILGRVHTKPGTDAMASVMKREPMIPLTNVTIAYGGRHVVTRDVGAMIVNRMLVDWISPTADAARSSRSDGPRRPREDAQGLHEPGQLDRAVAAPVRLARLAAVGRANRSSPGPGAPSMRSTT